MQTRPIHCLLPSVLKSLYPVATGVLLLSCGQEPAAGDDNADIVAAGAGSYSTALPEGCKPLPEKIYKTADVKGPTVTGQWWSSLLWQEFSANMFAHPLAMVCTPQGLAISYPGSGLVGGKDAIMGGGVTKEGDFRIELAAGSP